MDIGSYKILVLFEGYSFITESGTRANSSCTLLKGEKNIIVDTLTAWDGLKIVDALKKYNLQCDDIHYVICTHGHSDHIGCNYLFKNALHIVGHSISKEDLYYDHDFTSENYIIDKYITVMATPGHTLQDICVLIKGPKIVVAITGDLFEKMEDLENSDIWKSAGSDNVKLQEETRHKILSVADYIIPGHGPMFKNPKKS